ncbi:MAG TPA: glutamate 5-kinase, partial [Candidatus Janibacter merdipullorum]|nr:glutamate 5-kinase [Candidatus Janibacter merdipullorum]
MSGDARRAVAEAGRVVVKVGSSSLTSAVGGELDLARLTALVNALSARRAAGTEVVLVSSGAIASGIGPLGMSTRPRELARQQAAASVGQGVLLSAYDSAFGRHGHTVGQVLLTVDDITRRTHYTNARRTLDSLLEYDVIPIVNENDTVATDEIRFGDNDRLAALVAQLVRADALVLLTDVDALYTASPGTPGAERVTVVADPE